MDQISRQSIQSLSPTSSSPPPTPATSTWHSRLISKITSFLHENPKISSPLNTAKKIVARVKEAWENESTQSPQTQHHYTRAAANTSESSHTTAAATTALHPTTSTASSQTQRDQSQFPVGVTNNPALRDILLNTGPQKSTTTPSLTTQQTQSAPASSTSLMDKIIEDYKNSTLPENPEDLIKEIKDQKTAREILAACYKHTGQTTKTFTKNQSNFLVGLCFSQNLDQSYGPHLDAFSIIAKQYIESGTATEYPNTPWAVSFNEGKRDSILSELKAARETIRDYKSGKIPNNPESEVNRLKSPNVAMLVFDECYKHSLEYKRIYDKQINFLYGLGLKHKFNFINSPRENSFVDVSTIYDSRGLDAKFPETPWAIERKQDAEKSNKLIELGKLQQNANRRDWSNWMGRPDNLKGEQNIAFHPWSKLKENITDKDRQIFNALLKIDKDTSEPSKLKTPRADLFAKFLFTLYQARENGYEGFPETSLKLAYSLLDPAITQNKRSDIERTLSKMSELMKKWDGVPPLRDIRNHCQEKWSEFITKDSSKTYRSIVWDSLRQS